MSKNRVVPHRAKSEDKKTRETVNLKRENHSLKRKLKRLQKEVRKREPLPLEEVDSMLESAPFASNAASIDQCPECEGPVKVLTLAGKRYLICGECKWRKKAG